MVIWTNAVLMDVKRSDGTKNILGDETYMTCYPECGEKKGGIQSNSTLRHGSLNK